MSVVFDDGPTELTHEILDILAEYHATARFFVLGKNIKGREDALRRIVGEGHTIGNHGWSHEPMDVMDISEFVREVAKTEAAIWAATGVSATRFRPPFRRIGDDQLAVMRMDVELRSSIGDYDMTPAEIVVAAAAEEPPIYLHELPQTVEALPAILERLAA